LAVQYAPAESAAALGVLQARARMGEQEAVAEVAGQFLDRWHQHYNDEALSTTILDNLERHKDEIRLRQFLKAPKETALESGARHAALDPLWEKGELRLLAQGYEELLKAEPYDLDALYQLIAVRAQLGEFEEVDNLLVRWMHLTGFSMTETIQRLERDGRFRHFQIYRGHALLPFAQLS
jgi:hypothetical protein